MEVLRSSIHIATDQLYLVRFYHGPWPVGSTYNVHVREGLQTMTLFHLHRLREKGNVGMQLKQTTNARNA